MDETKHFITDPHDLVDEVDKAMETRDSIEQAYDAWLVDQGVNPDAFSYADLETSLAEHGVIDAADDSHVTLSWGRQLHAPNRWEPMLFHAIANGPLREAFEERGFDPVVRPFTLETDPWVNYNTEKRSYTYPAVLGEDGIEEYRLTPTENNWKLSEHPVTVEDGHPDDVTAHFGVHPDDVDTLPEFHAAADRTGITSGDHAEVPDFRGVYEDVLQGLVDSTVYPDHILTEETMEHGGEEYDVAVKLEQDEEHSPWYSGTHHGEEILRNVNQAVREGEAWMPAQEGYNFVVLPMTAQPNLTYMVRDGMPAEGKFAPSAAYELEERLQEEAGLSGYPMADIGAPSMEDGQPVVDEATEAALMDSKLAKYVDGRGHFDYDTALVSVFPSVQQQDAVEEEMDAVYRELGVYDGDAALPEVATALTRAMYGAAD